MPQDLGPQSHKRASHRRNPGLLVASGSALNLLGQGVPLVVAVFALPWTISMVGTPRFGALTIVWSAFGFLNLLDLGLSRAVTHAIASSGSQIVGEVASQVRQTLLLLFVLGIVLALLVALLSPFLVGVLRLEPGLRVEMRTTLCLVAVALPFVVSANGLRGILEALQRFDLLNAIRLPNSIFNYVAPLLVFPLYPTLSAVTAALLAGRIASWIALVAFAWRLAPALAQQSWERPKLRVLRPTITYASWIAVSNLVGPLMAGLDRYLLGALVSIDAVAYYATPYEAVSRLWIVPGAVIPVLFPIFAEHHSFGRADTFKLLGRSLKIVSMVLFPVVAVLVAFSHPILVTWLGVALADATNAVFVLLALGVFLNSLAQMPFSLLQAQGRPDITAKFHLLELPVFLFALILLAPRMGAMGAAVAWTLRVVLDAILVFTATGRALGDTSLMARTSASAVLLPTLLLAVLLVAPGGVPRSVMLVLVTVSFEWGMWRFAFSRGDRRYMSQAIMKALRSNGHR